MSAEPIVVGEIELKRAGSADDGETWWIALDSPKAQPGDGACASWSDWVALARRILERDAGCGNPL